MYCVKYCHPYMFVVASKTRKRKREREKGGGEGMCKPFCLFLGAPQQEWIHQVSDKPSRKNKRRITIIITADEMIRTDIHHTPICCPPLFSPKNKQAEGMGGT